MIEINKPLEYLNYDVWDRGFYAETTDGIWYELYVNDETKTYWSEINLDDEEHYDLFGKFNNLYLDSYIQDNQITFFQPNNEEEYTIDYLTDIFI
jgi:hypothetical protein